MLIALDPQQSDLRAQTEADGFKVPDSPFAMFFLETLKWLCKETGLAGVTCDILAR